MLHALRLPLRFDVQPLLHELGQLPPSLWKPHFNRANHDGGWQVLALRGSREAMMPEAPGNFPPESYGDLPLLAELPATRAVIDALPQPVKSARYMALLPGAAIAEHTDPGSADCAATLRLHIPVQGAAATVFHLAGERVPLREGECWALDISQRHRVHNRGEIPRIHLVVDCVVAEALRELLTRSDQGEPYPDGDDPLLACRAFLARCLEDESCLNGFATITDPQAFIAAVCARGAQENFHFQPADVASLLTQGRQAWIEQFIL